MSWSRILDIAVVVVVVVICVAFGILMTWLCYVTWDWLLSL